jgi:hypothetical protein
MTEIATEAGHWYAEDGTPRYTMIGANGKERPTTLRDARKFDLFPSVSGIMAGAASPGLTQYYINQAMDAALTLPRLDGESLDAFKRRALADSKEHANKARDLGSLIHGCIEKSLMKQYDWDQVYAKHVNSAIAALSHRCGGLVGLRSEKSFAHRLGYGGKVDASKWGFVDDFKCKDFDRDTLPATYENHHMQLAAYREGLGMPNASCAIIYVSTKVPGLTHTVEIAPDDLERGWKMFRALLSYWQHKNRYIPRICNGKEPEHGERERTIAPV